jgi:hypothetical protein
MLNTAVAISIPVIPPIGLTEAAREGKLMLAYISISFDHAFSYLDPWSGGHVLGIASPAQV